MSFVKKRCLALALSLCLSLFLCPAALAEGPAAPEPPDWIDQEDYLVFPGDPVYQPETWAKIQALRAEAQGGASKVAPEEGLDKSSVGARYELALIELKCGANIGFGDTPNTLGAFYSVYQALRWCEEEWLKTHEADDVYYRMVVEESRVHMIYWRASPAPVGGWGRLMDALDALGWTTERFFAGRYMELVSPAVKETAIADMEACRAERKELKLFLDGQQLELDVPPEARDGRTMVPIRAVAEAIGADVDWDQDTLTVTMTRAGSVVTMTLDSTAATVDGKTVEMDVAPYASDGRTLIPARYVAEFFGQKVEWDGKDSRVLITEDKSMAQGSNLEDWAINMGLIYGFRYYGSNYGLPRPYGEPIYFGMYQRTAQSVQSTRAGLAANWGVDGREAVISVIQRMTPHGHNDSFQAEAALANSFSEQEMADLIAHSSGADQYMWTYTKELSQRWGDKGILAWDLSRMASMAQWGYTAGYLTYAEALELAEPAAEMARETFSDWHEFYLNYLDGYNWWARNDVYTARETYEAELKESCGGTLPEGYETWMALPRANYYQYIRSKNKPLLDDTLFQTGVIGLLDDSKA